MQDELAKRLSQLDRAIDRATDQLGLEAKQAQLTELEEQVARPELWHNPTQAQALTKQVANLKAIIQPWRVLRAQVADAGELIEIIDDELVDEFAGQVKSLEQSFTGLKQQLLFTGKYDQGNAILRLSSGAGGDDAQDFTAMLERMYLRWAEQNDFETDIIERSAGEVAGVKTEVIEISGAFAYGWLRSEHGVHRLVRLSPFNAESRETSFALVEVLPDIDRPDDIQIDDKDLRVDIYRSGGKGGQGVNTTDSAVRLTHLPTGIVVTIQNERSQIQNKETALKILRSKLLAMKLEQHAETLSDLRAGESANWGSQIRNYVLHPYTLVKDTRTKHENRNTQGVLDGDIDEFIEAYLRKTQ